MSFSKTIINAIKYWVDNKLNNYVEVVDGKGLSTEDYTTEEKEKLASLSVGSEDIPGAVKYDSVQDLTDVEKEVARTNIGAGTSSFSGSYDDLTDVPDMVKSVNGVVPDGTGNIVVDIPVDITEGAIAHQQLVTDADGNTMWVDREFYKSFGEVIVPNATYGIYSSYGQNVAGNFVVPTIGKTYHVVFGDIETDKVAVAGNNGVRIGEDYTEFVIEIVSETEMYVETSNTGSKVIEITSQSVKKIDASFLPDLPLATADQYGLVKTDGLVGQRGTGESAEIFNDYTNNKASGKWSHAEGMGTTASGQISHAEGNGTTASGANSHAEGIRAKASGSTSHAEGIETIAHQNQHVQGKYNVEDSQSKYAHIVGNGRANTARSNAHTLDWAGLGWFAGGLKVGGISQDDEAAAEVALKSDLPTVPTNISGFTNDAGYLTTIPDEYVTESELDAKGYLTAHQDLSAYAKTSDLGSLASKDTVAKSDLESSVQASLNKADTALQSYTETDPTVPAWAKAATKPTYTASEVGADASGTASAAVATHNTAADAHADIREEIAEVSSRIVSEIKCVTEEEYAALTSDSIAEYYNNGARLLLVADDNTNLVPSSISKSGAIFNGCGYMNNYRLNSSGNIVSADASILTGYIPYTYGKTIRIKGGLSPAVFGGQYIAVYDSNFELLKIDTISSMVISGGSAICTDENLYIFTVDTSAITNDSLTSAFQAASYIRICLSACIGSKLQVQYT